MSTTTQGSHAHLDTEFAQLGQRLIRFGQALQEGSTTVAELAKLANSCGINFKLRVVAESKPMLSPTKGADRG
jgi:hypothetical protein